MNLEIQLKKVIQETGAELKNEEKKLMMKKYRHNGNEN